MADKSAFGSWDEWSAHRDEWEKLIRELAQSDDPAHHQRAADEFKAFENRSGIEQRVWGAIPEAPPPPDPDAFDPKRDDIIEKTVEETGSVLGETMTNPPTLGDQAFSFLKEQTTPEKAELLGQAVGTIPAWMAIQSDATGMGRGLKYPLKVLGGLLSPPAIGTAFHQASLALPWNKDYRKKEAGWGSWSGTPFKPWDRGTGMKGSFESGLGWETYGQGALPAVRAVGDVGRYSLMGGGDVLNRARATLDPYLTLGIPELAPSYAASRVGLVRALGPALLKIPGIRGPGLKQYEKIVTNTKDILLNRIKSMLPETYGLSKYGVSDRMYKAARSYGENSINAIDKMYKMAYKAADDLYGNNQVVNMRSFLDVVDEIRGGGLRTTVTAGGVPRQLRIPPPEKIGKWVSEELSIIDRVQTIGGFKDLQHAVRRQLDNLNPGDEGYAELAKLNSALTGSMDNFFLGSGMVRNADGVMVPVSAEAAQSVKELFAAASTTNKNFWRSVANPAGRRFTQVNKAFWQRRHLAPKSGDRYFEPGAEDAARLFETAFRNKNPEFLKNLEGLIGPRVYKMASQRWLNDAYTDAVKKGGGILNVEALVAATKIDTNPEMAAAVLKGAGNTMKQLQALVKVLGDHPIDPALQQTLVRRIQLQGVKTLSNIGVGNIVRGALVGGAASGGAVGGGLSLGMVLTALIGARQLGKALSRPRMLNALLEYGSIAPEALKAQAKRRLIPSSIVKLVRALNDELLGEDEKIDLDDIRRSITAAERATRFAEPLVRHISPLDTNRNVRWSNWQRGIGADVGDLLY